MKKLQALLLLAASVDEQRPLSLKLPIEAFADAVSVLSSNQF